MSARALRLQRVGDFALESGEVLTNVVQAYHLDGALNEARDNVVLVFHALTGSADAAGDWWTDAIGPGRTIDTDRYAVLCANLLGGCYGTTWEGTAGTAGNREQGIGNSGQLPSDDPPIPRITTRDQARLIQGLLDELGITSVALATGGSLGGMVAMEWAAQNPDVARSVAIFAAPAAHSAYAIAWNHIARRAIQLGGADGLEVARMIGMMTYRTADEQARRFGRERNADGGWSVGGYLDHHGRKLRGRFTVRSYLALLGAMDSHDVGAGRGGVAAALGAIRGQLIGVGIPGDLLYSADEVRAWTDAAGAEYREIRSITGHDAFLLESEQVAAILEEALRAGELAAV
ncbi:alpha/beta fold hydrolase [Longimicrobium sp.]|uniref:alpha/beta fold hydrolase n=1 Tax=Longimicrobium sp. TaxID=2029185 RepID=UPI002E2FAA1A|nr:homoserine O-acetyltransferase [Longimicrobium sp.]HEX6037496.1 homoserine O-acetyltransferase [Longimicrobium sp.]